jgi:serine/threonine protein kinase
MKAAVGGAGGGGGGAGGGAGAGGAGYSKHSVVASGSFGTVISPAFPNTINGEVTEFPSNVTKMFYKKTYLDKSLKNAKTISEVMNSPFPNPANHGHVIHPYTTKYKFQNLPVKLRHSIEKEIKDVPPALTNNLHLARMPNLGIDIFALHDVPEATITQLRNVPFYQLYYQFFKLFAQTHSLSKHGLIHYDIRDTNVMIKPDTGEINIIDFDFMNTVDEFDKDLKRGFIVRYQHPPECLMYTNYQLVENLGEKLDLRKFIESDSESRDTKLYYSRKRIGVLKTYQTDLLKYFDVVYKNYGINNVDDLNVLINEANVNNVEYLRSKIKSGETDVFKNHVLKTIDNYGLSLTLLQMLGLLYPNVLQYAKDVELLIMRGEYTESVRDGFIGLVKTELTELKITNNGTPYTDKQLNTISRALLDLSYSLTMASSFELRMRPSTFDLMEKIGRRVIDLAIALFDKEESTAVISYIMSVREAVNLEAGAGAAVGGAGGGAGGGGAGAGSGANKGGGRRHHSSRRRRPNHKRKFNTRNKRL